jgi:hypothetical protein
MPPMEYVEKLMSGSWRSSLASRSCANRAKRPPSPRLRRAGFA